MTGSACTMFTSPSPEQGHLVLDEGLLSVEGATKIGELAKRAGIPLVTDREVVFAYVPGPRTKTKAENAMWLKLGAHVNSMTLGPEVVLANELGMAVCAIGVGHKRSGDSGRDPAVIDRGTTPSIAVSPGESTPLGAEVLAAAEMHKSLVDSADAVARLVQAVADQIEPPAFRNYLYSFHGRQTKAGADGE